MCLSEVARSIFHRVTFVHITMGRQPSVVLVLKCSQSQVRKATLSGSSSSKKTKNKNWFGCCFCGDCNIPLVTWDGINGVSIIHSSMHLGIKGHHNWHSVGKYMNFMVNKIINNIYKSVLNWHTWVHFLKCTYINWIHL